MTWGHFQLPEEASKTQVNYITSSVMLPKKNHGTCVCYCSEYKMKKLITHVKCAKQA